MSLHSICVNSIGRIVYRWEEVERDYDESAATLETEFGKYPECPSAYVLNFGRQFEKLRCVYQGVVAGRMLGSYSNVYSRAGVLFLENEWREIRIPELNKWMNINLKTFLAERMNF